MTDLKTTLEVANAQLKYLLSGNVPAVENQNIDPALFVPRAQFYAEVGYLSETQIAKKRDALLDALRPLVQELPITVNSNVLDTRVFFAYYSIGVFVIAGNKDYVISAVLTSYIDIDGVKKYSISIVEHSLDALRKEATSIKLFPHLVTLQDILEMLNPEQGQDFKAMMAQLSTQKFDIKAKKAQKPITQKEIEETKAYIRNNFRQFLEP